MWSSLCWSNSLRSRNWCSVTNLLNIVKVPTFLGHIMRTANLEKSHMKLRNEQKESSNDLSNRLVYWTWKYIKETNGKAASERKLWRAVITYVLKQYNTYMKKISNTNDHRTQTLLYKDESRKRFFFPTFLSVGFYTSMMHIFDYQKTGSKFEMGLYLPVVAYCVQVRIQGSECWFLIVTCSHHPIDYY